MMRRHATLAVLGLCVAAAGCRGGEPAAGPRVEDARRQAVRAFWDRLRAANDARLASGCTAAAPLYEQALQLDPGHEDALYYAGQCQRALGRGRAARALLERLVGVNAASARGHLALAALLASPDPAEPFDLPAAEAHLRRAHEINAEETGPVVRLGEVLLLAGRRAEAREWLEAALRTNPKSVEAAFLAGFAAREDGAGERERLARRVVEALKVQAPVKGVLNEGDRRDAKRAAAPPLESPLGRLLFAEPIAWLRERSSDPAFGERQVAAAWRAAGRLHAEQRARLNAPRFASGRVPQ